MKRKVAMLLVMVCLMLNLSNVSYAAGQDMINVDLAKEDGIQPLYDNVSNISAGLKIEGNTAYCLAEVFAKKVNSIQVIMCLQHLEGGTWINKVSWVESANASSKVSSRSYTVFEKGSYRVKVYATVGSEKVTCTSVTKTY